MSEHEQLSHVLHQSTATLHTDAPRLVAAGMARGRRRARRRTTATSLAALAVVGATGVGVSAALPGAGPADDAAGPQFAAPVEAPAAIEPVPDAPPAIVDFHMTNDLAVAPADFPATFASLIPGEVTSLPVREPGQPIVDFLWNGYAVRVGLSDGRGITEPGPEMALDRCKAQAVGLPGRCRQLPDGSGVHAFRSTGPAVDGGVSTHWARVYREDGWDVWVTIANAADTKESPLLADTPPLTPRQLLTVATSPVWWD